MSAEPCGARVAPGTLDDALAREIARREDAARLAGAREERERAAGALDRACEALGRARRDAEAELAGAAVEIGLEIGRVLVRAEVAAGRHRIEAVVREALALSGSGREPCVVHVHPADAEALASARFRSGTKIEADESVARGDVHVSTSQGLLVREIDEALRSIGERLRAEVA